jgi:hypothetical protein
MGCFLAANYRLTTSEGFKSLQFLALIHPVSGSHWRARPLWSTSCCGIAEDYARLRIHPPPDYLSAQTNEKSVFVDKQTMSPNSPAERKQNPVRANFAEPAAAPGKMQSGNAATTSPAISHGKMAAALSADCTVDSVAGGHKKLRNLWDAYLADALLAMEKMDVLATAGDFEGVRSQAQYLKDNSMVVGALGAATLCHQIEVRAAALEPLGTMLLDLRCAVEEAAFAGLRLPDEG